MKEPTQGYSVWKSALLNAFWVPLHFQDTALITIAVPAALLQLRPADHVRVFAVLAALISFVAMIVPPVAGALSDRLRRRGIPRGAFIVGGAALDAASLIMLAEVHSLPLFAAFLLLATFAANVSLAAYQALIPDIVPKAAWGQVSGVRSVAMVVGTVLGIGVAAGTLPSSTFIAIGVAAALGALSILLIRETPAGGDEERAHVSDWHDFTIVFISRAFLAFGLTLLMAFVLYFFKDILHVADPSAGTGIVAAASLVGAIVSGVYLGWLSDRVPRKYIVAACGIPMALATAGFGMVPQERWMFGFAFFFGIGFGGVLSTGWALAIDSVPKLRDVARDLGIWGIAQNFPAVIAPLFGGWLLGRYAGSLDGYRMLFFTAAGSFALASVVVLGVGARPVIPWWGIPLRIAAALAVAAYTHAAYRIRSWGKLPVERRSALVVSNHQTEIDLMAPFADFILRGGFRSPVFSASAKSLYEPGFMALRIPWLWRVFANVNLGWLFTALGLMQLENELQARSLARWAWAVQRRHGVLPLAAIFKPETVERLNVGELTTADLRRAQYFRFTHQTRVRLSELNVPYRREIFDETRAAIEEDLSRMEAALRRGATAYITPEGEYSKDGAMLPFRGLWDRLSPSAQRVFVAAISYDPFVGRKLSELYRVKEVSDKENIVAELAAARPVTVSALTAEWLSRQRGDFSPQEISTGVATRLDTLPAELFIDPELARNPQMQISKALARMAELGILRRHGERYQLSERRVHPAFAGVEDVIAFQARLLTETIAAIEARKAPAFEPSAVGSHASA